MTRKIIGPFIIFMLVITAAHARASTVVLLDTTKPGNLLPPMLAEVRELAGALPDGERLTIYRLGQGWIAAFDDDLTPVTRIKLGQVLTSTYAVKGRPNWLTSVTTAVPAAGRSGAARVFIFTPNWRAEVREGPYKGRALLDLLEDERLAPADVQFFVRVPGGTADGIERSNVKVLADAPDWNALIQIRGIVAPEQPAPATTRSETNEPPRSNLWRWVGVALGFVALTVLLLLVGARRSSAAKASRGDGNALDLMARAAAGPSDEAGPHEGIVHRVGLLVHGGDGEVIIAEGEEVFVGDHYKARPLFVADGAHVVLSQKDGALTVVNPGRGSVRIGKFELKPGQSMRVPLVYFEMVIGKEKLTVSRQKRHDGGREANHGRPREEVFSHE